MCEHVSMKPLRLLSSDGVVVDLQEDAAHQCRVIKQMMDDLLLDLGADEDDQDHPLPVPVLSIILKKVVVVLAHFESNKSWPENFFLWNRGNLVELLRAADFLDAPHLMEATCEELCLMMKGMTVEQIQTYFCVEQGEDPLSGLPRDVKLDVLSRIGELDWKTLMDTLPEVCEDWRWLARDPLAWRRVDYECECLGEPQRHRDSRLLRDAPALRKLNNLCCRSEEGKESLRMSRAVVEDMYTFFNGDADVMWRSRHVARSVSLNQLDSSSHDSEGRSMLAVLACMEKLQKLIIYDIYVVKYQVELSGRLRKLESCLLPWPYFDEKQNMTADDVLALTMDVLDGASETLECVHLDWGHAPVTETAKLVDALNRCTEIREFRGPPAALDAVRAWPKLEKVAVCISLMDFNTKQELRSSVSNLISKLRMLVTKGVSVELIDKHLSEDWRWRLMDRAKSKLEAETGVEIPYSDS